MSKEEIFEQLKEHGCVAVYLTGSSCNPYIKAPRDTEYIAVFETKLQSIKAPYIYNVHKYHKNGNPVKFKVWAYEFHYINKQTPVGEKQTFEEPSIELLVKIANKVISYYDINKKEKIWYHVAMVKAIEKYGYDNIPENVAQQINDLHDLKIAYASFEL